MCNNRINEATPRYPLFLASVPHFSPHSRIHATPVESIRSFIVYRKLISCCSQSNVNKLQDSSGWQKAFCIETTKTRTLFIPIHICSPCWTFLIKPTLHRRPSNWLNRYVINFPASYPGTLNLRAPDDLRIRCIASPYILEYLLHRGVTNFTLYSQWFRGKDNTHLWKHKITDCRFKRFLSVRFTRFVEYFGRIVFENWNPRKILEEL